MTKRRKPGVFCIETQWEATFASRSTVRPLLDLLDTQDVIKYVHRDAATVFEFEHYLKKWAQKGNDDYSIAYIACHGAPGVLQFSGTRDDFQLETLAAHLEGKLAGRTLYFGSCETLAVPKADAREFVDRTGARAICGYTTSVEWLESASFDITLFDYLTSYARPADQFRKLRAQHLPTWKHLGFRAMWKAGEIWT